MTACLIDIGNTSIKIGIAKQDETLIAYTIPTDIKQSADSLGLCLQQLVKHANINNQINNCFVSSVVPALEPIIRQAVKRFLLCPINMVPIDYPVPLKNTYAQPKEVGADRLVAAYAARLLCPNTQSVISVDYGTATTFDCVTKNNYLGGLICPGVMSSLGALSKKTARLPKIALNQNTDKLESKPMEILIGKNTETSLNYGFLYGFAAMTEGILHKLKNSLEGNTCVVASGGFAKDIAKVTDCFDIVKTDLILEGLKSIWIQSKK